MTVVQITCKQLSSFLHDAETRDEIKRAQQTRCFDLKIFSFDCLRECRQDLCVTAESEEFELMRNKESGYLYTVKTLFSYVLTASR